MIVFAVIAVIIVAVPVSFYELSSQPQPTTSVVNDYAHYQWDANFYNHANETCPLFSPYFNASAVINETGYQNTTLLISIHGFECYLATEGQRPWFVPWAESGITISLLVSSSWHLAIFIIEEDED